MAKIEKARFWAGVLYPENMREDWKEDIGDILQHPYAYCVHTQDRDSKSEHRKDHVHLIVAFPNTTTYKHALNVMGLLSAEGKRAINKCEAVVGIRNVYDYLIHDTEDCRKKGKELYTKEERVTGNGFDIGAYEQLGIAEKNEMFVEMSEAIREHGFTNYMDFYEYVADTYEEMGYIEVMRCYSGHFERLTKGNYQRWIQQYMVEYGDISPSQGQAHEKHTKNEPKLCPKCGSINLIKKGRTAAKTERWQCKDCGKTFV